MTNGMSMRETVAEGDVMALCEQALAAGAVNPMSLRFRVVEYDKFDGTLVGVAFDDLAFDDAVEQTADLIRERADSHFCLQPLGYLQ